jgi:hypothetical protein
MEVLLLDYHFAEPDAMHASRGVAWCARRSLLVRPNVLAFAAGFRHEGR